MIDFYGRTFATVGAILWRARVWIHVHPRWARVLFFVLLEAFIVLVGNELAYADSGSNGPAAPFLMDGTIADSSGIPIANYVVLPISQGDLLHTGQAIINAFVSPIWIGNVAFISWTAWLCNWLLSFEWVQVLSAPFNGIATVIQSMLGRINWIPFALVIGCGVAAIAIMVGRHARGWSEIALSALCAVLATGMLANPVATLTAAGGALDKAEQYGSQISAAVVNTDRTDTMQLDSAHVLNSAVTSQLVDIFVRIPAQTIAFGHVLSGQCATEFNNQMKANPPAMGGDDVRNAVNGCDSQAKAYNENGNFGQVWSAATFLTGGSVMLVLPLLLGGLLVMAVIGFLVASIKAMVFVYWGILPVDRYPLWRALADMLMGLVSIVFMTIVMAAVLKLSVAALTGLSKLGIPLSAQMMIANLILIVLLVMLWRSHKLAKRAGRSMAEQLSRFGLGRGHGGGNENRGRALATMAAVTPLLRRPDRDVDARSINIYGRPAAPVDGGMMTATRVQPTSVPAPSSGGGIGRLALPVAGAAAQQAASTTSAGAAATKTADLVFTGTRIAKGAAGGLPGVIAAAAVEVGSRAASKGASRAIAAARTADSRPDAGGSPTRSEGRGIDSRGPAATSTPRIVVDSSGVGHIQRPAVTTQGVTDISSLPPRTTVSTRSLELRARLNNKA